MRSLLLALPLCLGGCTTLTDALAPPYVPEPIHIYDQMSFASDVIECRKAGANYKPHFSFGNVATAAIRGASSDTSLVPLSPLVPVYGAAGGAAGAAADGLDVMSGSHANVYRHCLHDETLIDHSAVLANPGP
jgi:hypothetical protein